MFVWGKTTSKIEYFEEKLFRILLNSTKDLVKLWGKKLKSAFATQHSSEIDAVWKKNFNLGSLWVTMG